MGSVAGQFALFEGLDAGRVQAVLDLSELRRVDAGHRLFEVGDEANELFLVEQGRIELVLSMQLMGAEQSFVLQECTEGDVVAWSALIPPHRLTLGARATVATRLRVFDRPALLAHFDTDPVTGCQVMGNLSQVVGRRLVQVRGAWIRSIQRSLTEKYR